MMENLQFQLAIMCEYFREVRYAAILNKNGDVVCTVDSIEAFPPEFEAFVMSFMELSQNLIKIFSNGSTKSIKLRGMNKTIFYIYNINPDYLLVFYSITAENSNKSFVMDFDGADKCMVQVLEDLNKILA